MLISKHDATRSYYKIWVWKHFYLTGNWRFLILPYAIGQKPRKTLYGGCFCWLTYANHKRSLSQLIILCTLHSLFLATKIKSGSPLGWPKDHLLIFNKDFPAARVSSVTRCFWRELLPSGKVLFWEDDVSDVGLAWEGNLWFLFYRLYKWVCAVNRGIITPRYQFSVLNVHFDCHL